MANERIKGNMRINEVIEVISGGNPGAIRACDELKRHSTLIDPDDGLPYGLGNFLNLDTLQIWDGDVHRLWNNVCKGDVGVMIALLRAWQLGVAGVTEETLREAITGKAEGIDLDAAVSAVKERLPNFNPARRLEVPDQGIQHPVGPFSRN